MFSVRLHHKKYIGTLRKLKEWGGFRWTVAWNRIRGSRASFEAVQIWVCCEFGCIDLACPKSLCDLLQLWKRKLLLYCFLLNHPSPLSSSCLQSMLSDSVKCKVTCTWEYAYGNVIYSPKEFEHVHWTSACASEGWESGWLVTLPPHLLNGGQLSWSNKNKWIGFELLP